MIHFNEFDVIAYFETLEIVEVSFASHLQLGVQYGFIFFFTAMLIGKGLNYAVRLLKL